MLKAPGLCLFLFVLPLGAETKVVCALGPGASSYKASADQRPTGDAMELAGRINAAVKKLCGFNCPEVMIFRNTTAANAIFVADGSQARLIYSPQFFASVHESYGDAGILALIAHELGHALDDTLGAPWVRSTWGPELRADAWAGCTLAGSNLNKNDLADALNTLAKYPSASHPAWSIRLPVVRAGYMGCGGDGSKLGSGTSGSSEK